MGGSVRCHLILGLREEEGGGRGEAANLIPRGGGVEGFRFTLHRIGNSSSDVVS